MSIRVVHLVWAPLGPAPLERFLHSYAEHAAGIEHELCIVYNGFRAPTELAQQRALLAGVRHSELLRPGYDQDINSYLAAARASNHEWLCVLNSYSTLLADNWLAYLYDQISRAGVGLVGATGSYESAYSNLLRIYRAGERLSNTAIDMLRLALYRGYFDPFPNQHIRTNGFMIARQPLLRLRHSRVRRKFDAHCFESGSRSLTRQVLAHNLRVLVVGRNGVAYPPEQWPHSGTFRQGEQANLLIADNRTHDYACGDTATRAELERGAWGVVSNR